MNTLNSNKLLLLDMWVEAGCVAWMQNINPGRNIGGGGGGEVLPKTRDSTILTWWMVLPRS